MKKKPMQLKKLGLNKRAITALDNPEQNQLAGGASQFCNTAGISYCGPCITQNPVTVCGNCPTGTFQSGCCA